MSLYLIGLGLHDENDITLRGLEAVKKCSRVYLESYTSVLQCTKETLEKLCGKKLIPAGRELVENRMQEILDSARRQDTALLVAGDPFSATTHVTLLMEARKQGIAVNVVHNASILTAVGITGLQLYKFGKTTSIPFATPEAPAETPYQAIRENRKSGLHTLVLLDLDPAEQRFMSISEAIGSLLMAEQQKKQDVLTPQTLLVGAARLGSGEPLIRAGTAEQLLAIDFGKPPHSLIVPAKTLHFMEEEALRMWM